MDESIIKVELTESEQSSENINLNFVEVPSMEGYHSNVTAIPRRPRRLSCRRPLQISKGLQKHKEKRLRPIRPKPFQSTSSILKHKFELPMINMTTLPSNHIISNMMPIKENIQHVTPPSISNEMNSYIRSNNSNNVNNSNINNSNIVGRNMNIVNSNTINDSNKSNTINIQSATEENKINETVKVQNFPAVNNNRNNDSNSNIDNNSNASNESNCSKSLHSIKDISKSHKNSIELFFESMAQTVLNLPNEVQADVKMQICKLVTQAEIQHYHKSQAKSMTKR